MLLRGLDPKTEKGKQIFFEKYQWNPLWSYCFAACHAEKGVVGLAEFKDAMYYKKKKFSETQAFRLAEILCEQETLGHLGNFFRHQRWDLRDAEMELCICKGVGCDHCGFRGFRLPEHNKYRFSPDDIHSFIDFLKDCGGFEFI